MIAAASPAFVVARPASTMLFARPARSPAVQLTPKPSRPPPCDDGKHQEKQAGVEALGWQSRNQEGQQQDRREGKGEVDPPAFRLRIKSVDELAELGLHERPACADRVPDILGKAGVAVGAAPARIDQQEFQRGNNGEPQQQRAHDRKQDVGRRIEQARSQEADKACGLHRRGALGNEFPADEGRFRNVAHPLMLRPIRQP